MNCLMKFIFRSHNGGQNAKTYSNKSTQSTHSRAHFEFKTKMKEKEMPKQKQRQVKTATNK